MAHSKYINPFTDFGFKKIFGEEANKDILIDFLNAILPEEDQIKTLEYKQQEHLARRDIDRKAIYDLYCENDLGEKFIVELQRAKQEFFKDRTLYYATFPIQEQAEKGTDWKYELKGVYVIGLMNFTFDNSEDFHHNIKLRDEKGNTFYDKLSFVYLELPKFSKPLTVQSTIFEKWIYAIKNMPNLDEIPPLLQERTFKKLFKISEYSAMNETDKVNYEESLKTFRDYVNTLGQAKEEGIEIGEKRGEKRKAIEAAKSMLIDGLSIDKVVLYSGLTIEEVKNIKL
ncbi:Rpn family recombination-promoting nuclease/putative transposase [Flammeovirga aprica]|uniref:PD-(D/E)XK nuclease family transposase n=1 Tax=Flammeovirga aprica JL-4 TaxID=694437 RepID=A0A7X9RUP4_9BACT|nr:Rpn family recombination-promoting nuclease/putative transposase [Flammeovirga aprica]NME69062.1 PD-(D/E)XK nuclease family transposase [Flammeovirga aprica JL-4]